MKALTIAVTGGIGSGKSTVCKYISEKGYQVISCDDVYKELLQNEDFVLKISNKMNVPPIKDKTGKLSLNKSEISNKVFNDKALKRLLEDLTHPAIMKEVFNRASLHRLAFVEVPLLFENGLDKQFDHIIIVLASKERRISAVMRRDGLTEGEVVERIKNQVNHEIFCKNGHTVICNDSTLDSLKQKVDAAINEILQKMG